MTPEGRVKKRLKERVLATGGCIRYLRWLGRRSALDTFVWWPGQPPSSAFVEVKRPDGGRYESGQEREIERMATDGFNVFTVRSFEDIEMLVDKLRQPVDCST